MRSPRVLFWWLAVAALAGPASSGDVSLHLSLDEVLPRDKPALLVFFSTTCGSCFDELFEMRYFVEAHGLPIEVIGVTGGPREEVAAFLDKYAYHRPVVLDGKARIRRALRVDAVPLSLVIRGGRVVCRADVYQEPQRRREEIKRCLLEIGSR
ncbi:MAG: TlpA family protein disulfide reductase [Candidatus Aminicenantes bacterium]|nr:TlpA family protein disulfide reductase [Candidatus Aminicenantes bacterium]